MSTNVVFFAEQRQGALRRPAFEAATLARSLADHYGGASHGVVIGEGVTALANEMGSHGVDVLHVADDSSLKRTAPRAWAEILAGVCGTVSPAAVIVPNTATGRDVAPRLAALLQSAYAPDCIAVAPAPPGPPRVTRPMYAGKVQAEITFAGDRPPVIGIRPGAFTPRENPRQASVTPARVVSGEKAFAEKVVEVKTRTDGAVDLGEARIVVSGGRGLKGPENFPMLQALADALGGALGASRAAVDAGWIDHSHQVGQTGRTVAPDLYFACGISGAIQHLAGMSSSRVIVAINKDPEAPIFKIADYGVVADLFEIVPILTEKARRMRSD